MIENLLIDLEPCIRTATIILMHSLWQGILIAFLAAVALALLRNGNARTRYAVSCGAMVAVLLTAVVTALCVWPDGYNPAKQVYTVTGEQAGSEASQGVDAESAVAAPTGDVPVSGRWWQRPSINGYIFLIWVIGVMLISLYHFLGWRRARRFVKEGTSPAPLEWQARFDKLCDQLNVKRLATLLSSSLVEVPCVVGWVKPVILIPVSMFTMLRPSEIEMILVHELAHVRRYDVLVNILQATMETLFFFNPAVWWVSRKIRIEQENCCDDAAMLRSDSRLSYARALTNLEELRVFQTRLGSALNGTPLERRIRRIVGATKPGFHSAVLSFSGVVLIASLILIALGLLGSRNNSVLQASEKIDATENFKPELGDLRGEWETESDGDVVKILVYGKRSQGMNYAIGRDEVEQLVGNGEKSFQIIRDAGTLFLEGTLEEHGRKVEGSGEWYFRPDTAYVHFMSRYGLHEDDTQKVFSLAIRDISREYLAEMDDRGYHDLSIDQLISAGVFGISPELVDEYRQLGYPDLSYQQLLSMQVQGVTPEEAREFERAGAGHPTADQLISARINGVTPEFVREFREAGFHDLSFNNFITLNAFKIDADDFEDCYRHRFMDLSEENMVWVCGFGFTREDIERMQERGYTDIDSIIRILAEEAGR